MRGFIFGGDTNRSYEDLKRSREVAQALVARSSTPRNLGEGLAAIGNALMARGLGKQVDAKREEMDAQWQETVGGLGLDPQRAAIFGRMDPSQRDSAVMQLLDRRDAEARAQARSGASAARAAAKDQEAARQRRAIAQALMPSVQQRDGVALGPTVEAAQAGAQSGGDLGILQTEAVQRSPQQMMAAMLSQGVDPSKAISVANAYQDLTPQQPKMPSSVQEFEYAQANPEYSDWVMANKRAGAPTSTVNVGGGEAPVPAYPKAPGGFMYVRDPATGQVVLNDQGIASMAPIVGGPEDTSKQDAQASQTAAQTEITRSNVVMDTVKDIRSMLDEGGIFNLPEVGVVGSKLNFFNQEAADMSGMLETLKGMVVFDRLEQLKRASATGASGLGQVTEKEIDLLGAQLGALRQDMSKERIINTLDTIEGVFGKLTPEAQAYLTGQSENMPTGQPRAVPSSNLPDFSAMSDEELDAYIAEHSQ